MSQVTARRHQVIHVTDTLTVATWESGLLSVYIGEHRIELTQRDQEALKRFLIAHRESAP